MATQAGRFLRDGRLTWLVDQQNRIGIFKRRHPFKVARGALAGASWAGLRERDSGDGEDA